MTSKSIAFCCCCFYPATDSNIKNKQKKEQDKRAMFYNMEGGARMKLKMMAKNFVKNKSVCSSTVKEGKQIK
jgi:hypothetical protein